MTIGIVGYGAYIPRWRLRTADIACAQTADYEKIHASVRVVEKSVPGLDEDSVTLAVAASNNALARAQIQAEKIGAIFIGSESHPYAVKPTGTMVLQALGIGQSCLAADLEFACKAGTAALLSGLSSVKAGFTEYALSIGTDTAQSAPGDVLEYTAAAGSAAFIVGADENLLIATVDSIHSITSDTPDFWRRGLEKYPEHTGRFTAEPSYFYHVETVAKKILNDCCLKPSDIDYVIFHQPNGRFPRNVAMRLGFSEVQVKPGLLVEHIGNTYSASSLLGLCAVFDCARAHQKILLVSYGSGSGSDALLFTTTELLEERKKNAHPVSYYIEHKEYLSYLQYRRHMDMIY